MDYSFKNIKFVKSVVDIKDKPISLPEILFVGKSNVGKSSLINAICNNKHLAYTSSKPGMTKMLNYFSVDNKFYIVDCPGYGYSAKKDFDYNFYGNMLETYFKDNNDLKLIIFLLDSRIIPGENDIDFFNFLKESKQKFVICFTKSDKLNQSERARIKKNYSLAFNEEIKEDSYFFVSIKNNSSLEKLKQFILNNLGA